MASGRWDPEEILLYPLTINSTLSRWRRPFRWVTIFWPGEGWGIVHLCVQAHARENEATRRELIDWGGESGIHLNQVKQTL